MTLRRSVVLVITAALSAAFAVPAGAQSSKAPSSVQVVKVRVPQLTLYDKAGNKIGTVARDAVKLPVPVLEASEGSLKVRLGDGREVWVKSYTVETDKTVSVPGTGGTVGSSEPKSGSSRGLGGEPTAAPSSGQRPGTLSSPRPAGPAAGTPGAYPPPSQEPPSR